LIVGLQDADKIGHAGSISVFGPGRNVGIGHGLAPWPKPHEKMSDVFHGVLSATNRGSKHQFPERKRAARSGRKAGGHYAADLVLQLPARGAGSVAFHFAIIDTPSTWLAPLHAGMG
jgi:hypothetical protein